MNKKAFTLIELLVVVLIIAILAAIALPKYMVARDRAHLSGLMAVGKNVQDAMDRRSLFDDTTDSSALEKLDITFKDYQGNECTGGSCRITISGKDYNLSPSLNAGGTVGRNYTQFASYENTSFGSFLVLKNAIEYYSDNYYLYCYGGLGGLTVDKDRCVRLGKSLGSTSSSCSTSEAQPICSIN